VGTNTGPRRWLVGLLLAGLVATSATAASATPGADAPDLDVIVRAADSAEAARVVTASGGEVRAELAYLGGVTATMDAAAVDAARARHDVSVTLDHALELAATDLATSGPETVADQQQLTAMNLPAHWTPDSGSGVGVALLDTGVADVPELGDRVIRGPDYSGDGDGIDRHGHGTFMAGLIAGDGRVDDEPSPRFGVAPGAHIVSVKLAGRDGITSLSRVLDAVGWVIANQDEHGVRVLNLSLGVPTKRAPQADPLAHAVEAAWAAGLTVVTASGNEGDGTVTSPGRDPWVITVGATDATSSPVTVPDWSGSGKVVGVDKPEVLAPGVSTVSLRAPGSSIDEEFPEAHVDDRYMRGSGTSMSTALVAGGVAVLAELRPYATPDDLKGALASTGGSVDGSIGAVVDLAAADLADPDPAWHQHHPIAFKGANSRLRAMPWQGDAAPGVDETWQRARWLDGAWQRAKWLDEDWARAKWLDEDWARAKWLDEDWARAKWLDEGWARAKWLDEGWARARWLETEWQRAKWLEASFARAKWLDANFARARWLEADWARARWLSKDWSSGSTLQPFAAWDATLDDAGGSNP
jgi:serine protease AprX